MDIKKAEAGMVVWDVLRRKMGNTTMSTTVVVSVKILEVDLGSRKVMASWNHNAPRWQPERVWKKWRAVKPVLVGNVCGAQRLATKEERAAMAAE